MEEAEVYKILMADCPYCGTPNVLTAKEEYDGFNQQEKHCEGCHRTFIMVEL